MIFWHRCLYFVWNRIVIPEVIIVYIHETINRFYQVDNQIKLQPIYMGAKNKYKSKEVLKEIENYQKKYILGNTVVIYCIDTDDYEKNPEQLKELQEIKKFCKLKSYELVWFCHEIEEVYFGKRISDSDKVKEAANFRRQKKIKDVKEEYLYYLWI